MNRFTYELPFYYSNEDSPGMGFETKESREYSRKFPREYPHRDLPARAIAARVPYHIAPGARCGRPSQPMATAIVIELAHRLQHSYTMVRVHA